LESRQAANYYARVLRVIGQDIADLFPIQLEIEQRERTFVVRVRCDRKRSEGKGPAASEAKKSGLGGIIHKLANYRLDTPAEKPEITNVNRSYGPSDISRLDEAGMHRRIQLGKIPDIRNLGEALRTVGRIIDAEEGRLTRVFKDQRRVIFDYVVRGGQARKVEMTLTELYKIQQSYYQTRSVSQSLDLWKGKK
jgi:hypothetical protein